MRAVLVDAAEGYGPVHDICHWIGRAATVRARRLGVPIELFELALASHPDTAGDGLRLMLDDQAFAWKLDAPAPPPSWIPHYEEVGEARVREGRYASVLRYGSHVSPVIDRLLESVQATAYAADLGTSHQ